MAKPTEANLRELLQLCQEQMELFLVDNMFDEEVSESAEMCGLRELCTKIDATLKEK